MNKSKDTNFIILDDRSDFDNLCDINNLIEAYRLTSQESDWKESVQKYGMNLLENVRDLQKKLYNGMYKQKPFYEFTLRERGKERNIRAMHVSDRVVQRALCDCVLIPKLRPYLIYDNGASLKGKGVDFTRNRLQCHLEKYIRRYGTDGYILQLDFKKFFDSIPHKQLLEMIGKHIDDQRIMELIKQMIDSFGEKSVGIGSQISQICGVFYATEIDNYCKIVRQCKYYGRYNDDIYIIHQSKDFLKDVLEGIKTIADKLELTIHPKKTQIVKLSHGFTFMQIKYDITPTGRIIKRISRPKVTRERRKLKKYKIKLVNRKMKLNDIVNAYRSWRGNAKRYDCKTTLSQFDKLFYELFGINLSERNDWHDRRGQRNYRTGNSQPYFTT